MTLLQITGLVLTLECAVAAAVLGIWLVSDWRDRRHRQPVPRDRRWDSTEAEVWELPDVLRRAATDEVTPRQIHIAPSPFARALPAAELTWEERRARYAAYVERLRRRAGRIQWALETPTAEYRITVRREFGVELTGVGPREADIHGQRIEGRPWEQPALLEEVS